MSRKLELLARASLCALGLGALACSDPFPFDSNAVPEPPIEEEEICESSDNWFPDTPELPMFKPEPHPAGECPFYRGAWQNFLRAMQPTNDAGRPAIQDYPTIDDVFASYTPHGQQGTSARSWLGDIKQAGRREILIDQNGRTLFYGIHMNDKMAAFIKAKGLDTPPGIQNADPNLFFPEGMVEFKSAWQVVDDPNDPSQTDNFITTMAWLPHVSQDPTTHEMLEDKDHPEEKLVRLLAIHVVFTLPGHPEFVWGSFEHTTGAPDDSAESGHRDLAPNTGFNPDENDRLNTKNTTVVSDTDGILYKAGTQANEGNKSIESLQQQYTYDEASGKFTNAPTSIYRMFPASKSNTIHPDDAITSLNHNVEALFAKAQAEGHMGANDKRNFYRLVGAQWMDKPAAFANNSLLQNDTNSPIIAHPELALTISQNQDRQDLLGGATGQNAIDIAIQSIKDEGSDSAFSILAGEDRMSSTAMESFTQSEAAFPNCFACHNTTSVNTQGVPHKRGDTTSVALLLPGLLNVSHVLSQVILEQCDSQANFVAYPDPTDQTSQYAKCPPMATP